MVRCSFNILAIIAPDIARYAKSKEDDFIAVGIGFIIGNTLLRSIGAILAISAGSWDLVNILQDLGLGVLGLGFLVFVQWTTEDNGLYSLV